MNFQVGGKIKNVFTDCHQDLFVPRKDVDTYLN